LGFGIWDLAHKVEFGIWNLALSNLGFGFWDLNLDGIYRMYHIILITLEEIASKYKINIYSGNIVKEGSPKDVSRNWFADAVILR
jgi:hypothetical protein